ncbi:MULTISPECIES: MOSC domain-containing protein [unclassified Meiothermus]|uniref:MOSC domain-containing protein n=1 Tax=unclassified Meiothermus TaxID=370471 RepID=UPI000D7BBA74|nr:MULTISPECIES: MOSC domain-containing protein [unclassified Meiothermus]PZA08030.1 MOSC domain-containing protein [Meiothermus sp. Pnk-1]RYM32722.1 MOSC domain-containing protein [Meiothermus sp. PNK-Is4]
MKVLSVHASRDRGFPRLRVEAVKLVPGYGIAGDRKAGKREQRAVLLLGQATYEHLESLGFDLPYGALGENMVLDLDPHLLRPGTKLRVGEALLEVSLYCTPCKTLKERYGSNFPQKLGRRRGMLARVLEGGTVQAGDAVQIL